MADQLTMYEFPYIVDGVLSEEQTRDLIDRVTKFITENGGQIIEIDEKGSQRLAYPIKKRKTGYYVIVYMNAPGDLIAKLERAMQINDGILRFMTLKYDAKMKRHYQQQVRDRAQTAAAEAEAETETA